MKKHVCSKETEIELIKQSQLHLTNKIDDIHKAIMGTDNKKGLLEDMNEYKALLKATQIVGGAIISLVTIYVTVFSAIN